jgi:hypothetical protein
VKTHTSGPHMPVTHSLKSKPPSFSIFSLSGLPPSTKPLWLQAPLRYRRRQCQRRPRQFLWNKMQGTLAGQIWQRQEWWCRGDVEWKAKKTSSWLLI